MNDIANVRIDRDVTRYDPAQGAMLVHASEAAERAAARTKDAEALARAIVAKLEAQRDFAADYRTRFPPSRETGGPGRGKTDDRSVARFTPDAHCRQFGFHIRTVQRWAERLIEQASFEVEYHERMAKAWRIIEMEQAANFSSDSVEWYTPARYIDAARKALGKIDLDPASSAQANETVKATEIFTQKQDGLEQDWRGRAFLNPPYGKSQDHGSLAGAFCDKAIGEYESGNVDACIILVNSVHSQQWQARLYDYLVCFVDHRIQFVSADGEENKNPTFQNIFVYLGPDTKRFVSVFNQFGYVMRKYVD
jgi:hypothetical protein